MLAPRARTLSWRRGDDGVRLGQSGLLGCRVKREERQVGCAE
jgi:hypothetical protein